MSDQIAKGLQYDDIVDRIYKNAKFRAIVKKKQSYSLTLLTVTLGMYLAIIFFSSFARDLIATPIAKDMTTTWGIPAGFFLIICTILLIVFYVKRTNNEFDQLNKELLEEVTNEAHQ